MDVNSSVESSESEAKNIVNIIGQRDYYKNAFEELTLKLNNFKNSITKESQTENIMRQVSSQTEQSVKVLKDADVQVKYIVRDLEIQTELNIEELKEKYQTKISRLQSDLQLSHSEKMFLKSSFKHSQEEQSKAYKLADSYRLEKERIAIQNEQLSKQIPILESVKNFIEQNFEQSQEEVGKAKNQIEQMKHEIISISDERGKLQSKLAKIDSILSKLKGDYEHLQSQYKTSEHDRKSLEAQYIRSQAELEQTKEKISQISKKTKALVTDKSLLESDLESLSSQLTDSVHDANGLRSLNQKLLADYNSLVSKLFQGKRRQADLTEEQNLSSVLKELNLLLDETRSNEIELSNRLKERNATISDLSEKVRIGHQEKLENEQNYQKAINDLSLQHAQALEVFF